MLAKHFKGGIYRLHGYYGGYVYYSDSKIRNYNNPSETNGKLWKRKYSEFISSHPSSPTGYRLSLLGNELKSYEVGHILDQFKDVTDNSEYGGYNDVLVRAISDIDVSFDGLGINDDMVDLLLLKLNKLIDSEDPLLENYITPFGFTSKGRHYYVKDMKDVVNTLKGMIESGETGDALWFFYMRVCKYFN